MIKVHLDTDLGGDIDDLCALAFLLRNPDVDISGLTVVGDTGGKRTGYVRYVLNMENRNDIPVACGSDTSGGFYPHALGIPDEKKYWPEPITPSPNNPSEAVELLKKNIENGATIICIGPLTNLYLLETKYSGILKEAKIFIMGGYIFPPRPSFPEWKNKNDYNIQIDAKSSLHVLNNSSPTLIPVSVTVETYLRRKDLERIKSFGPLGSLLARQAEAYAIDQKNEMKYGKTCKGLPTDIINFQHDPLTAAIATGWRDGVEINEMKLTIGQEDGHPTEKINPSGRLFQVVTKVDPEKFNEFWLRQISDVI